MRGDGGLSLAHPSLFEVQAVPLDDLDRDLSPDPGFGEQRREVLALYPLYAWMGLTDPEGRVVAASNPGDVGKEMRSTEWFREVKSSQGIHLEDVLISGLSGEIPVVGYSAPCNDLQGRFIGVLHAEVELSTLAQERLQKQMVQAEKLALIGQLTAGVAHEAGLRSPRSWARARPCKRSSS